MKDDDVLCDDLHPLTPYEGETIIDALDRANILYARTKNGVFEIGESCDGWYRRYLTYSQVDKLIEELLELRQKMGIQWP